MAEQVGYIRVSSVGQNTSRQLESLQLDFIFKEKISAKDTNRPKLNECLQYVRQGDTLHVHSIDRLARNLADLQQIVEQCTDKGVAVKFHKENLTFTGQNDKMQTLLFHMLGAVAQFERALIKERQLEGIAKAKIDGKHLGRPVKITERQRAEIRAKHRDGMNPSQLSREYNISRASVYNVIKKTKSVQ